MTSENQIEEILILASEYGIRKQVIELSLEMRLINPKLSSIDAYEEAFKTLKSNLNE